MLTTKPFRRTLMAAVLALSASLAAMSLPGAPAGAAAADPLCVTKPASEIGAKVLPVGDSLTVGASGDYTWRYFLWKQLLVKSGSTTKTGINFVGPHTKVVDPVSVQQTSDDYICPFDQDTGAYPGTFLSRYLIKTNFAGTTYSSLIKGLVKYYNPAVVIMFIGINDLERTYNGSQPQSPDKVLSNAKKAVAEIRAAKSNAKIIFSTVSSFINPVVPSATRAKLKSYNDKLVAAGPGWSTSTSPVRVVRTVQNWGTTKFTYDGLHPNVQGEVQIAHDFAVALNKFGVGPKPAAVPSMAKYLGPRTVANLSKPTVSGTKVTLRWTMPSGSVRTIIERADVTGGGLLSSPKIGKYATRGAKGLIDGVSCVDANGTKVAGRSDLTAPYRCTYTDTITSGKKYSYRLRSGRGLAGTYLAQNPSKQVFLYAASLRSAAQRVNY
ncbi:MAG: fibronectin type iii protein [Marmoricola sp.]|nr:fibronectin type iii protein [Marmoricola sp.]